MNNRTLCLLASSLVLALVGCAGNPPTSTATQPEVPPPTIWPTFTPPAGMTAREKEIFEELSQQDNPQTARWDGQCAEIFKTQPWCSIDRYVKQITRPEWDELLPDTQFYLVEYERFGTDGDPSRKIHNLIVEQDGKRYHTGTYDQLLTANHIEITGDNRELIARSWALMTIPDFLVDEVRFTGWGLSKDPSYASLDLYDLKGWTRLGGLEIIWSFTFASKDYGLVATGPWVVKESVGDFVGTPFDWLAPRFGAAEFFPVK